MTPLLPSIELFVFSSERDFFVIIVNLGGRGLRGQSLHASNAEEKREKFEGRGGGRNWRVSW